MIEKKKLGDRKTRRSKMLLLQIPHFYSTDKGRSTTKSIGVLISIKNSKIEKKVLCSLQISKWFVTGKGFQAVADVGEQTKKLIC